MHLVTLKLVRFRDASDKGQTLEILMKSTIFAVTVSLLVLGALAPTRAADGCGQCNCCCYIFSSGAIPVIPQPIAQILPERVGTEENVVSRRPRRSFFENLPAALIHSSFPVFRQSLSMAFVEALPDEALFSSCIAGSGSSPKFNVQQSPSYKGR
jgi:hypothetical protein